MDDRHWFLPSPSQGPWEVGRVFASVSLFVCFLSVFSRFQLLKMHLQVKSSVSVLVSIPLLLQQPSKSSFEAAPKLGQKCVKQSCSFLLCCGTWGPACIHALPLQAPAKESCWGGSECRNLMGTVQSCSKEAKSQFDGKQLRQLPILLCFSLIRGETWGSQ